jgi:hypothetical protein
MTNRHIAVAAAALIFAAHTAAAQELPPGTTPAATGEGERERDERPRGFTLNAGYDSDSLDTTYAFVSPQYSLPIGDRTSLLFKLGFNYLRYEFESSGGSRTEVKSPGISPGVGLRFDLGNTDLTLSTSIGFKDREKTVFDRNDGVLRVEDSSDTDLGVGAAIYSRLTRRQTFMANANYNTADGYLWSRAAYKVQVAKSGALTWAVGVEGIGQGNEDIKAYQGGGLVELGFSRQQMSLTGRVGYKKATYEDSDDRTGTYYGVNFYKRF